MKYRTFDARCRAKIEGDGPMPSVYKHRCMIIGKEVEPGGAALCFEHNIQFQRDRKIMLYGDEMLVEA
jgi:hypothetical protein